MSGEPLLEGLARGLGAEIEERLTDEAAMRLGMDLG